MTLAKRDYVTFKDGAIDRLFCKICGDEIAGTVEAPRGSGPKASQIIMAFKRFSNYAEAKIEFDDGHFHVTNGCKGCLSGALTIEQMEELHNADMGLMPEVDASPDSTAIRIVAVDTTGTGLM